MGKVVDIDPASRPKRARGRKRPSKTALVLGGGGFTGGVYEIGALRALDLLAVNSTVNDFDVYVGTSAGSFVAGMLANGITPDEMMQVINRRIPSELEDLNLDKVLRPNYLGFVQKAALLPLRTLELVRSLARMGEFSAIDVGVGLAEALPTGFYSGGGVAEYVASWEVKYPGVDIVLVEPEPNDELMFGTPIMDYSRRLEIARHGFESVTATLAEDYDRFREISERHGLEISQRRVRRVVEHAAEEEPEQASAWRRVLEQTTSALLRQSGEAS